MKTHRIKLNIEFCDDVYNGIKPFEVRNNDRAYQKGDRIQFEAYGTSSRCEHHINQTLYEITYVLSGWGIEKGFVVLGIRKLAKDWK